MPDALPGTSDELLGVEPLSVHTSPRTARLLRRLEKVQKLPRADRRAVLKFVDALAQTRGLEG